MYHLAEWTHLPVTDCIVSPLIKRPVKCSSSFPISLIFMLTFFFFFKELSLEHSIPHLEEKHLLYYVIYAYIEKVSLTHVYHNEMSHRKKQTNKKTNLVL